MCEINDANVYLAALALATAALVKWPDEDVFTVRATKCGAIGTVHRGSAPASALALERLAALATRRWMFEDGRLEYVLYFTVAVVDEEEAAAVEPEAFHTIDDARKSVQLCEDDGDLVSK